MSAFLGKIHFWMYNKIRLLVEREEFIYAQASENCGDLAEEGKDIVQQTYGAPLPNKDLAELIDHRDIHGWLQRQLNRTQCREAAFVTWLHQNCSIEDEWLQHVYEQEAQNVANRIKVEGLPYDTAESLYERLQDVQLNGMPCDAGNEVLESSPDKVVWQVIEYHAEKNWQRAEANIPLMKTLYIAWSKSFVESLNHDFEVMEVNETFHIQHK